MAVDPISAISGATSASPTAPSKDRLANIDANQFLTLLITELQNQDPLNPTDNGKILEQLSQIRSIQSTSKLNETLDSVLLGQNLASASSMVDKLVHGLSDEGKDVYGRVEGVTVVDGVARVIVDSHSVDLKNVKEILSSASTR